MKYSQEEIIHALEVIQETCNERDCCQYCPFWQDDISGSCRIRGARPEYWDINKEQSVWRAFKE